MPKKVMRSVRLPTGLNEKLQSLADSYDTTVSAILCDAVRRGLLTYSYVPWHRTRTITEFNNMAKALKNCKPLYEDKLK